MLFALGLGDRVVAVTHECDHPPEARQLPHLTRSAIPEGLGPEEVDKAVRSQLQTGRSLYELDADLLRELDVDLIVAQQLCAVCAVSYDDVCRVASGLPSPATTISLDPECLGDVLDDVVRLAEAAGTPEAGRALRTELEERLDRVRGAVLGEERPRVMALEWHDPPFSGGHWIPEMIEAAGGEPLLSERGERSRTVTWEEIASARPDVVVSMPCGYDAETARSEAERYLDRMTATGASGVWAVDAAASFSRPGPRLVTGTELLANLLHPDRVEAPRDVRGFRVGTHARR